MTARATRKSWPRRVPGSGLTALAVTDHDGFYGVVRFNEAARELGLPTVFGAELSLELPGPQNGQPDPVGRHLLALARGPEGYARLSTVLAEAHLRGGEKGKPVYDVDEIAGQLRDHVLVLTGCRKGQVPAALAEYGMDAAAKELDALVGRFGADGVAVELTMSGDPLDADRNDALVSLAERFRAADRGDRQCPLCPPSPTAPGHRSRGRAGSAQPG